MIPTPVTGISNATALSVGSYGAACAVLAEGSVQCWGFNGSGQLGNGTTTSSTTPVFVSGINNAKTISVSSFHTCAVLTDGSVKCWGANNKGQLGNGTTTSSTTPVFVSGISSAITVSASDYHTCTALANGSVQCWGSNYKGQLGNGTHTFSLVPTSVTGINNAVAVDTGGEDTCALLVDTSMKCWGDNTGDRINIGGTLYSKGPFTVRGVSNVLTISSYHGPSCATLTDGTVSCWGDFDTSFVFMPGPSYGTYVANPRLVSGINNASKTSASQSHACSVLTTGIVKCWGYNISGQLGDGTTSPNYPPVSPPLDPVIVSGISNAVGISTGDYIDQSNFRFPGLVSSSCAVLADGRVMCWGGYYGVMPVQVAGINNATAVSIGRGPGICALLADGTVVCWDIRDPVPVLVALTNLSNAKAISYNGTELCALLADGTITCGPSPVVGISNAVDITVGQTHKCATLASGAVQCWGNNFLGQLGNNTTTGSLIPVTVSGISNAVSVSAGEDFTYARLADGTLAYWGAGPLGNNYYLGNYSEPIQVYGPMVWNTGNPGIASISPDGLVAAVASGTAPITVSTGGFNASTTATVKSSADLSLNLTATPASVLQGQAVSYTVSITNNGPGPATGVTATGSLPSCTIATLLPGATDSCTATVTATIVGTLTQTMSVRASESDPNLNNNTRTVSTTVISDADIAVSMTDAPDPVRRGAKLTYTINVINKGPLTASNVTLTDTLPSNVAFVGAFTSAGKCSGKSTVNCNLGKLANGSSVTINLWSHPCSWGPSPIMSRLQRMKISIQAIILRL